MVRRIESTCPFHFPCLSFLEKVPSSTWKKIAAFAAGFFIAGASFCFLPVEVAAVISAALIVGYSIVYCPSQAGRIFGCLFEVLASCLRAGGSRGPSSGGGFGGSIGGSSFISIPTRQTPRFGTPNDQGPRAPVGSTSTFPNPHFGQPPPHFGQPPFGNLGQGPRAPVGSTSTFPNPPQPNFQPPKHEPRAPVGRPGGE